MPRIVFSPYVILGSPVVSTAIATVVPAPFHARALVHQAAAPAALDEHVEAPRLRSRGTPQRCSGTTLASSARA